MKWDTVLAVVFVWLCFKETYQLRFIQTQSFFIIFPGIIVRSTGSPASFYEMMDEFDEIEAKYEIMQPTIKHDFNESTTTPKAKTYEMPLPKFDNWKQRGTYRLQCVDETKVSSLKVMNLMLHWQWESADSFLHKWALCVLHKMGLMSLEGVFRMDEAMAKIPPKDRESAEKLIDKCLPNKPMEPQLIAWEYVKCHKKAKGNFSEISIF